ncbi:glyoxylate/hydroxypyruvate reductase A [Burkholderia ubonensis]|uniref:Glyoxylate/hydroxypyruvate reductase A n=2 Tax=Burkholderia cepacia complex TaxID=87882 RepID=A0A1B4PXV2_BURCE|nr:MULTISPECIES: glyoxylate/hydroxypyruvate reductase A [Burkholderia cepacia complex]AOK18789.1 glyoxylate/hydroxypyruvate reductase A [Burkholderia cepacia]AOK25542.1 glyoxylate/hydroxypyruvate reductase A [Burkholderia ubonensis]KVH70332.1 glyoxylate/hydroxypyruvate reductase A [Burkholderia ubonensis]KVM03942.1 glyoxylate/hydroxypyruvate reductase A [Burkholderia ubonensis]KVM20743.1 glyoxylate/hydroxypyruvate reductase A [Burkholderia ubonensis]
MTTIALLSKSYDMSHLAEPIRRAAPGLRVAVHGEPGAADAEIAACWDPPPGALAAMPNLRLIHSIAAGVDNILADPALPALPLCRVVDPQHARGMSEFVTWGVLHFHRRLDFVLDNQRAARWFRPTQAHPSACTVGIMGLGEIGSRVAVDLRQLGFAVRGWARQPRALPGIDLFEHEDGLRAFLAGTDILVCLLPLTSETRGILSAATFAALKPRAKLIHVGRGEHLVAPDLAAALYDGQLGGAIVDVFPVEPLPPGDPLWRTPNLIVTPHMASVASDDTIGQQVAQNVLRLLNGEPLRNLVDVARGY